MYRRKKEIDDIKIKTAGTHESIIFQRPENGPRPAEKPLATNVALRCFRAVTTRLERAIIIERPTESINRPLVAAIDPRRQRKDRLYIARRDRVINDSWRND